MKKFIKKFIIISTGILLFFLLVVIALNDYVLPWYVSAPELKLPNIVGKNKVEAIDTLKALKLVPIDNGIRYDARYPKNTVIFQNPHAGSIVKENRRVYILVSGGEPMISMPLLVGKTIRDAKITLERLGLKMCKPQFTRSEYPANTIVEQEYPQGKYLVKGDSVLLKVSVGPQIGMIRVPNLLGKSLYAAKRILRNNSLKLGKINYQKSPNLLPNTVIDQYPSENQLVNIGDSVDVFITKNIP